MPQPTGPTDPNMLALIKAMRKSGRKDIAKLLSKPRRTKKAINVARIGKAKSDNLIVAGKVLGSGEISTTKTVYAWQFSKEARKKIERAGGKCLALNLAAESKEKIMVIK